MMIQTVSEEAIWGNVRVENAYNDKFLACQEILFSYVQEIVGDLQLLLPYSRSMKEQKRHSQQTQCSPEQPFEMHDWQKVRAPQQMLTSPEISRRNK